MAPYFSDGRLLPLRRLVGGHPRYGIEITSVVEIQGGDLIITARRLESKVQRDNGFSANRPVTSKTHPARLLNDYEKLVQRNNRRPESVKESVDSEGRLVVDMSHGTGIRHERITFGTHGYMTEHTLSEGYDDHGPRPPYIRFEYEYDPAGQLLRESRFSRGRADTVGRLLNVVEFGNNGREITQVDFDL